MSIRLTKLEAMKDESTLIFDTMSHNGYPLLNSLALNYLQHGLYRKATIVTNNTFRWKDVITRSTGIIKCELIYHELFNIASLASLNLADGLLVIDSLDLLLEIFGGKEVISLLLKSKRTLSLMHKGLHPESTLLSLKAISPFYIYLDMIEGAYVATTFNARPPKLLKQLEIYHISSSFNLTSTPYKPMKSKIQGVISRTKKPSSTFRLETDADEEAVRTLVANPFLDSEESVSEYVTGKGSSDSESDPDDDLNL